MFLAPTFALNYGLSFAALTAAIVHVILFHRKQIWHQFRASREQEPDIHLTMMKKYKEAPDWWYAALFLFSIALGLAGILAYDSQLPCMWYSSWSDAQIWQKIHRVGLFCLNHPRRGLYSMLCYDHLGDYFWLKQQIPTCMILGITNITLCTCSPTPLVCVQC